MICLSSIKVHTVPLNYRYNFKSKFVCVCVCVCVCMQEGALKTHTQTHRSHQDNPGITS